MSNLVIGNEYDVYDQLSDVWNGGYEYLGYDVVQRRYFFRFKESYDLTFGQTYMFISIYPEDVKSMVR